MISNKSISNWRWTVSLGVFLGVSGFAILWLVPHRPPPSAQPVAVPSAEAGEAAVSFSRRAAYRYSVVRGGIYSQTEMRDSVRLDSVVAAHYRGMDIDRVQPAVLSKPARRYVSYRQGDRIFWTAKPVQIAAGEVVLTDGNLAIRSRCGNRLSEKPQLPVAPAGYGAAELELDEIESGDPGDLAAMEPSREVRTSTSGFASPLTAPQGEPAPVSLRSDDGSGGWPFAAGWSAFGNGTGILPRPLAGALVDPPEPIVPPGGLYEPPHAPDISYTVIAPVPTILLIARSHTPDPPRSAGAGRNPVPPAAVQNPPAGPKPPVPPIDLTTPPGPFPNTGLTPDPDTPGSPGNPEDPPPSPTPEPASFALTAAAFAVAALACRGLRKA